MLVKPNLEIAKQISMLSKAQQPDREDTRSKLAAMEKARSSMVTSGIDGYSMHIVEQEVAKLKGILIGSKEPERRLTDVLSYVEKQLSRVSELRQQIKTLTESAIEISKDIAANRRYVKWLRWQMGIDGAEADKRPESDVHTLEAMLQEIHRSARTLIEQEAAEKEKAHQKVEWYSSDYSWDGSWWQDYQFQEGATHAPMEYEISSTDQQDHHTSDSDTKAFQDEIAQTAALWENYASNQQHVAQEQQQAASFEAAETATPGANGSDGYEHPAVGFQEEPALVGDAYGPARVVGSAVAKRAFRVHPMARGKQEGSQASHRGDGAIPDAAES